jgi:parallel beta-helix repeat protein
MKCIWITVVVVMTAIVAWSTQSVLAAKLYVAANGVDSAACGEKKSPCRSISRAIQNANNGDSLVVGPGRYGDLNGDGVFDDPGDEAAEVGSGCFCMIKIDKPLSIESRDGAAATVLDARGTNLNIVQIELSGAVFGKKKKGFTLTHAGGSGLVSLSSTAGVRVTGNVAIANGVGFGFNGNGNVFAGNVASANSVAGFSFVGSGHVLTGNVATGNGFQGFVFHGSGHILTGNVATGNGIHGFVFTGSGHVITGNVANANSRHGFIFSGSGHLLNGNSALGNKGFGILIGGSGGTDSATIIKNNLFGNNNQPFYTGVNTFTNCGLLNQSGDSFSVPNNFWGATGPGADPADNVCNEGVGSSTTVPSFATKEFKVKIKALEELPTEVLPILSTPAEAPLRVYSLTGQLLAIVADQTQLALATRSLANSVYVAIKIYADGRREMVKVVVTK